jgi:hypothetical protein
MFASCSASVLSVLVLLTSLLCLLVAELVPVLKNMSSTLNPTLEANQKVVLYLDILIINLILSLLPLPLSYHPNFRAGDKHSDQVFTLDYY